MATAMINAKMTVETPDGLTYIFPKVELAVTTNVRNGEEFGDDYFRSYSPAVLESLSINGYAFRGGENDCIMTVTKETNEVACEIPELYPEDLDNLKQVMVALDTMTAHIPGIFSIEIRVLLDDVDQWAVVGYGDAGVPALLRFESV